MANTLKFGDGQWATKYGSTLAYNDENGNFKPLPFLFERRGNATRVNKEGLIEIVGENIPRIDYLNDSNGALLLEPSRTNLIPYSNLNFGTGSVPDGWVVGFGTGTYSHTPTTYQGQPAVIHRQETTGRSYLRVLFTGTNAEHTVRVKFDRSRCLNMENNDYILSTIGVTNFETKTWADVDANGILEFQTTFGADANGELRVGLGVASNVDGDKTLVWSMPQMELGSYATSYIPTQGGSAVTRLADNNKIVNSPILKATNQFTLFFDAKDFVNYATTFANIMFTLGAGESPYDSGTGIHIYDKIWFYFDGSSSVNFGACYNATTDSKFAISYDGTKFTRYANGVKLGTNTVSASMSNWDTLTNGNLSYSGVDRVFDLADLKLYNTALTDQEAIALTQV